MNIDWKSKQYLYNVLIQFQNENNINGKCDVFRICQDKGWNLIPYPSDKQKIFCEISADGFTKYQKNQFFIFFNPRKPHTRIKFTIAHEIGHIVLYHHFFVRSEVLMSSDDKKTIWEDHADIFAQNLLMPAQITNELKQKYDVNTLAEVFDVSKSMVITRLNKLYQDNLFLRKYHLN